VTPRAGLQAPGSYRDVRPPGGFGLLTGQSLPAHKAMPPASVRDRKGYSSRHAAFAEGRDGPRSICAL